MENLHIVILAAGLSQRLGFAKQLILKNGQTLLAEKIQLALSFSQQVTVVIPQVAMGNLTENDLQQIHADVKNFPVQAVLNSEPKQGMALSIKLAYQAIQQNLLKPEENLTHTRVLFLTIDQVALTAKHLYPLCQNPTITSTIDPATEVLVSRYFQADNFATTNGQKNTPIWGVPVSMPYTFLAEFVGELHGDRGFGAIFKRYQQQHCQQNNQFKNTLIIAAPNSDKPYRIVPIDLPELAWDIDTVAHFEALKERFGLALPDLR